MSLMVLRVLIASDLASVAQRFSPVELGFCWVVSEKRCTDRPRWRNAPSESPSNKSP